MSKSTVAIDTVNERAVPLTPGWLVPLSLTLFVTVLNAVKPAITVDEAAYAEYVRQIAQHPLDPYGFLLFGAPANHTLAPPVLLYWLAGATRLFGSDPFALKLSLAPLVALFVWSSYGIARRFARGLELPLLFMLTLAPAPLANWDLMLDMPAAALGLTALNLFFDACDASSLRRSTITAAIAGLCVACAAETKYTAFVPFAAMILYGLLHRRFVPTLLATVIAVAGFAAVEAWFANLYGDSHFLFQLTQRAGSLIDRPPKLALRLITLLGALSAWLLPLALAAAGARRRAVVIAACWSVACFVLIAIMPGNPVLGMPLATWLYGVTGAVAIGTCVAVIARLFRGVRFLAAPVDDIFLVGWLGLALGGYFAMFPFAASDRVIMILFVATLAVGRLAVGRDDRRMPRAGLISAVLCVATGLLFALVDIREAFARKTIAERSVAWIRQQDPGARIWGAGGIVYHAQRAGMQIDWDTTWGRPCRACRPGDWIVVDGLVTPTDRSLIWSTRLTEEDRLPLTTFPVFYFGGSPMLHLSGPRATADIYRLPQP